jgi:hypothetical protein
MQPIHDQMQDATPPHQIQQMQPSHDPIQLQQYHNPAFKHQLLIKPSNLPKCIVKSDLLPDDASNCEEFSGGLIPHLG